MVSTCDSQIKIWEFQRGVLKLVYSLQGHEKFVQILYIRNLNTYLISCSDQIIKLWKLFNNWQCLETISLGQVNMTCIVTDSTEKLIIFGSADNSIQTWQLNQNNNLSKTCSLMKHSRQVNLLSLNQSETLLVSCGVSCPQDRDQIIVWERTKSQENPFQFKYFVRQNLDIKGPQIKFINNEQFVLISSDNNKVLLFEDCKGELIQNFGKDVELSTIGNSERLFPIQYNIQKKLLYFKIKSCIYILDSNLQLQSFLKSNGENIQGCVTYDGKYLVYWDGKNKGYSIFEISYL
ncbi:unnamed protein product [Paramecium pentaurelia]|uniref:Uncharacterized protein n=1 Tax=Paramecium pentaurelia TaxID=43138 RepID=A0A8S1XUH6_9CILI|nr:unnamed protein product [Paramecium pentaurelia]